MNAQASPSITPEHMLKQCPSNATQQTQRNATNATSCSPGRTPYVPDAPDPVDNEVQVTREDMLRTRVVLAQLQGEQECLAVDLDATGLTNFADRADWLIAHRTDDQKLAWERHWQRLGIRKPKPRPRRGSRLSVAEMLDELDWLLGNGATPWEAAAALGSSRDAISRLAYRHGRLDLGKRMQPSGAERAA